MHVDQKLPIALVGQVQRSEEPVESSVMASGVAVGSARRAAEVSVDSEGHQGRLRVAGILGVLVVLCLLGWLSFGGPLGDGAQSDGDVVLGVSPDNSVHAE